MTRVETLDAATLAELQRLNEAKYLAFSGPDIESCRELAGRLTKPFSLVEIGSNRGGFSRWLAHAHPGEAVLALEWREKWIRRAESRARQMELDNLTYLLANARVAIPVLCPARSIRGLFILFPDPWWKQRHESRRLVDPAFLDFAATRLTSDGLLFIKTDVKAVMEQTLEMVDGIGSLEPVHPLEWPDERDWVPTTREQNCLVKAMPIFRMVFRARSELDPVLPPGG